ncbi:MAG: type II toxin-antitoxin system HicB family antitoxin [Candidatus Paceibacterota bacterium]
MKKSQTQYYVSYERDAKGGYIASIPAISGCVIYGKTLKEAHKNVEIAAKECLEVIRDFKRKSPKETMDLQNIRRFSFVKIS